LLGVGGLTAEDPGVEGVPGAAAWLRPRKREGDMAEHTKGPWTVRQTTRAIQVRKECEFLTVAEMDLREVGDHPEALAAAWADAYLISAAPDLLTACEQILRGWGHQDGVSRAVELARVAVAKAKGG
jgi:hypothetical protein